MGFLSQLVGTVVDAVESATGNEDSEAGNALEDQAAAVEDAASDAADAAAEAASEAAGFVGAVMEQAKDTASRTVEEWVVGGFNDAGIPIPNQLDLKGTVNLVVAIGELTGRKVGEKLERVVGPTPVRVGMTIGSALAQDGPHGAFEAMKGIVVETVDADGQIRDWMRHVGKVAAETSPAEVGEEILRRAPGGPVSVWEGLKDLLGGRQSGGKGKKKPISTLAERAEQEQRKFIEELRWVAASMARSHPQDASAPRRIPVGGFAITPDGIELQRLIPAVLRGRRLTPSQTDPAVSRHLAAAMEAAVRSALLHAQLLLWLSTIAHLARVRKASTGPSRRQPASPSLAGVRLPQTTALRSGR